MTTTPTAFEQHLADAHAAHELDVLAALTRGRPALRETTETTEYALATPVVLAPYLGGEQMHMTRVRVSVTTFHGPDADEPFIRVEGYAVPTTKQGKPKQNAGYYWRSLPESIAGLIATYAANNTKGE